MKDMLFSLEELEEAHRLVTSQMAPTPQYAWPQLEGRLGCKVWVKHENHGPTGAFKVRGAPPPPPAQLITQDLTT